MKKIKRETNLNDAHKPLRKNNKSDFTKMKNIVQQQIPKPSEKASCKWKKIFIMQNY